MGNPLTNKDTFPFTGGVNTFNEKALVDGFTTIQNMRPRRPGLEQRLGMIKHHTTTAHAAEEITSLYSFSKGSVVERHLFAQYEDGTIEDSTDDPPAVTTGNFGTSKLASPYSDWTASTGYSVGDIVFSTSSKLLLYKCTVAGTSHSSEPTWPVAGGTVADNDVTWEAIEGISPATFSSFRDVCIASDGVNQHQVFTGQRMKPIGFVVYQATAAALGGATTLPLIPDEGSDYTYEVTDGKSSTEADISSLDKLTATLPHALFIISSVPINKINFTFSSVNSTEIGTIAMDFWNGSTWTGVSGLSDGTETTVPFDTNGSISWTATTTEQPFYAFGISGFVYRWSHNGNGGSATLDADTKISEVSCEYTGGFQPIRNVWDGILTTLPEVKVNTNVGLTTEEITSESSLGFEAGGLGTGDFIYFSSWDPLMGIYLDVGATPNTNSTGLLGTLEAWNGTGWTDISALSEFYDGTRVDYTGGSSTSGKKSGFVAWSRPANISRLMLRGTQYYAYWYRFTLAGTVSAALTWSIEGMPYYDVDEIAAAGQTNSPWKEMMVYSFDDNYAHITPEREPMTLNGDQYGLLPVGDGRNNKILAMIPYFNELLVFQEEKGKEGGCVSILEGKQPPSDIAVRPFDKLVLSTRVGILNSKCVTYLEDVDVTDLTPDLPVFKCVFWLSRYGVFKTNGRVIHDITGNIKNYFDAGRTENIRAGYESKHWLAWDSLYNVLRIGIVSGSSATVPNVFLVYDPFSSEKDKWSTDSFATAATSLSCLTEAEAASGNAPVLQYGGCQDGYVRRVNSGLNDVKADDTSEAIDADTIFEVDFKGRKATLNHETLRVKAQTGNITREVAVDGNSTSGLSKTYSQVAATVGDSYTRLDYPRKTQAEHFAIRYRNNTVSQSMYLLDRGYEFNEIDNNS